MPAISLIAWPPMRRDEDYVSLLDFERWMELDLNCWVETVDAAENVCCIFRDPDSDGVAVTYYNSSENHQNLRQRIEQYARTKVEEK
ncbi:hypothetical protein BJX63DRAFT_406872 [Aspergillus granulosus]|uniref:Uncharacterized protein n=1 Tax=Aspergillus granulosus TaxID=176169 RepID=A0ABR4H0W7_9EURO